MSSASTTGGSWFKRFFAERASKSNSRAPPLPTRKRPLSPSLTRGVLVGTRRFQRISSFGRRETKNGARFYGGLKGYYRSPMKIQLASGNLYQPYPHTMVNVLFNDPDLVKYKQIYAETGEYPTTDHIDPSDDKKSENYHKGLCWATGVTQATNRVYTKVGKTSFASCMSTGRVQYREEGAEWEDAKICVGQGAAAMVTGHLQSGISKWLDDGKAHGFFRTKRCPIAPVERYEYRSMPFEVVPGFEDEVWYVLPEFPEYTFSDAGRYCGPGRAPTKGTKGKSDFYRYVRIGGKIYKVHDLIGRVVFGTPPSDEHTIDHLTHDFDEDGCYSNAASNLRGWADTSTQNETKSNGSNAESSGKPVRVTHIANGKVYEYTDAYSAALAWSKTRGYMNSRARDHAQQDDGILVEFIPQPDLVRVNITIVDGQVKAELEVERWVDIDPIDFEERGKFHLLYVNAKKRGRQCKKRILDPHPFISRKARRCARC